jgi:hypothetical protein
VLQGLGFSGRIFVEDQDEILAVGPLPDFRAKNFRQVRSGDVLNRIVFVHNHCHVVGKAGGNRSAKKCQDAECGTDSHHKTSLEAESLDRDHPIRSSNRFIQSA